MQHGRVIEGGAGERKIKRCGDIVAQSFQSNDVA